MKNLKSKMISISLGLVLCLSSCGQASTDVTGNTAQDSSVSSDTKMISSEAQQKDFSGAEFTFATIELPDVEINNVLEEIVDQYAADHKVKINIQSIPFADFRTWITTQFTTGNGPEVYQDIIYNVSTDYGKGWILNFKDLMNQENPYEPGKPWKESLAPTIQEQMIVNPAGDIPGFPTSTTVVRIFCNKKIFEEAGAKIPTTWNELMAACKLIQEKGKVPFAFPNATIGDLSWLWFNNSISNQLDKALVEKLDASKNGFVTANEMAKGFDEGVLKFNTPELEAGYELMKDFSQYWPKDYNGLDATAAKQMFIRGEAAMIQSISGDLRMIDELVDFDYVVVPVPVVTKDSSPYAMEKSVILGGQPDGIYAISSTADDLKKAAALDFVYYMSTAKVQEEFANKIYRIPLNINVALPEKLDGFKITEEPLRIPFYTGVNEQLRNYFHRSGQEYLDGSLDMKAFTETLNKSYEEVLGQLKVENQWSAENNYGIK